MRRYSYTMKNILGNAGEILENGLSGFHQYIFDGRERLCYVSNSLCKMTGYTKEEFLNEDVDFYASVIHKDDAEIYADFISRLKSSGKTLSAYYRIIKKDGGIIRVRDTVTVSRNDGVLTGCSVLEDITGKKTDTSEIQRLSGALHFGYIKYTCEKQPAITYMNKRMEEFLRIPKAREGELDYLDMYKGNIFLMIPMEERRRFAIYLNRVYTSGEPIAGEVTVMRCDGTKARVFGWIMKCISNEGNEEFQTVCMDITEHHNMKKEKETKRYMKALSEVYDKIFEYDRSDGTVKCLYGQNSDFFKWVVNIPMRMREATEKWIVDTVCDEDRLPVRDFFEKFYTQQFEDPDSKPPVITYRAMSSKGRIKTYTGIFLKVDASVSLFCCRSITDENENRELKSENRTLKNVNDLVMQFTEGVVAFEVENDYVKPLYTSENVCKFFGYTKEQWEQLSSGSHSIKDFISQSRLDYDDVRRLFATGEAEFSYFDINRNMYRRIKAICSRKNTDDASRLYIMLYNVDSKEAEGRASGNNEIRIRTFGYFDIFVNGKPIAFRSQKSKELFALLIDRRGGFVSSEEAISFLWEDEPINSVTLARYRKVALRLKNILEEYGIADIVEAVDGKRRIVTEKVDCDLYDYLSGKEEFAGLFKGSYLTNYSWGETTLAELTGKMLY